MSSEQEYLGAVDRFITAHDEWSIDPEAPEQPTVHFENAILGMFEATLQGDVPNRCRRVNQYVELLAERWRNYVNESEMSQNGCPTPTFWQGVANLIASRKQVDGCKPKRRESVKMLLEQEVPYAQIAGHIWGHRGEGPLCTNGSPDLNKIHEEADKPGTHIKADWVHPEDQSLLEGGDEIGPRRRISFRDLKPAKWNDEQVASYLREGANVEQCSGQSGRTVAEIAAIAAQHGIAVKHVENLAALRAPHEPTFDRDNTTLLGEATEGREADASPVTDIESAILKWAEDGSLGAPDIARMVSEETGQTVTAQKVNGVLRKAKAPA